MKAFFSMALVIFLSACASSPYTYYVKPTPINKKITEYRISEVTVNLVAGSNAIIGDDSFSDVVELEDQFTKYIESALDNKGLLAQEGQDSFTITVHIDYTRNLNLGGKALNKPEVAHVVTIFDEEERLASFSKSRYTTYYGYLQDMAVNVEIAAFSWDKDDELKDIEMISNLIVDYLENLGS